MAVTESFSGPHGARQQHLGRYRVVAQLGWVFTDIAATLVLIFELLVEILQQQPSAADRAFRPACHLAKLAERHLALPVRRLLLGEMPLLRRIRVAVKEDAFGRVAVAAGAPALLVVPLEAAGEVVMDDKADVGFVDTHSEGDGGDDDACLVRSALVRPAWYAAALNPARLRQSATRSVSARAWQ